MKFWKKISILFASVSIISVLGYFIYQASIFSGTKYSLETFKNQTYSSESKNVFINFGSLEKISLYCDDGFYSTDDYEYLNNNLSLRVGDNFYYFRVIDLNRIYSRSFNTYLFNSEG